MSLLKKLADGVSTDFEKEKSLEKNNVRTVINNQLESFTLDYQEKSMEKLKRSSSSSVLNKTLDKFFIWPQTPERKGK